MKYPEAVMRAALIADATFSDLVGAHVYPLVAPSSANPPYVVWRRSGIERSQTLGLPMGVPKVTVEYEIFGPTYETVREMADTMRRILDGYGGTVDNTVVKQVSLESESDDYVTLAGSDLPPVYRVTQSYDVLWQEI